MNHYKRNCTPWCTGYTGPRVDSPTRRGFCGQFLLAEYAPIVGPLPLAAGGSR